MIRAGVFRYAMQRFAIEYNMEKAFIFFPLLDILSMLPLSVSGLGLREGGYFYFLGKLRIAPERSVACGMLWFAIVLFNGLLGGVLFLLHRRSTAARSPEQSPQISL